MSVSAWRPQARGDALLSMGRGGEEMEMVRGGAAFGSGGGGMPGPPLQENEGWLSFVSGASLGGGGGSGW